MNLLICSDTHGRTKAVERAIKKEAPDAIVHLGDYTTDATALQRAFPCLPLYQVAGNCDGMTELPDSLLIELGGTRLLATHGHRYGVKQGLLRAELAAREVSADALLFGHTHIPLLQRKGTLLLLNPGAGGEFRNPSYAMLEIRDGTLTARLCSAELDGG